MEFIEWGIFWIEIRLLCSITNNFEVLDHENQISVDLIIYINNPWLYSQITPMAMHTPSRTIGQGTVLEHRVDAKQRIKL
jgi:hypothetical protein